MVKKKDQEASTIADYLKSYNEKNPIIATRYSVVEVTPSREYPIGDGHGGVDWEWTLEKVERVSDYYDKIVECQFFIDTHEADEGKTLRIRTEHLRRTVTERWE